MKIARAIYEKYLFHFEKTVNPKSKFKLTDKKHRVKLEDVDPSLLKEVPVYVINKKADVTRELMHEILSQKVAILRNA